MSAVSAILGPDGRPVSAERVRLEKQSRFNPLRGWTPDVLVRQLESFARGEIAALAWVMEWLEKHDDVIATVAPKAKAAVSRWGFDVLPKDEIAAEQKQLAADQQGFLQEFYQNLQTSDAVELEEAGGMRMLVQQVMDGYGKGYAAHHIIWKPSRTALGAELVKVPTWFFEVTSGRMRFLPSYGTQRGLDLDSPEMGGRHAWMISKGRGVMLAGVLARMFKQIPLQDWLTYCDRHGMPAFLGKTSAAKGSQGWTDMATAVAGIGSEFGAVVNTGDVIDVLNLTGQGEVPYVKLIDRMDKAQIILWRGGNLGTLSEQNSTGSNPQQDATDELDADNAAWVSETINRNLTAKAVAWKFGSNAPILCELKLRTKTRDNVTQDLACVQQAKDFSIRIDKAWYLNKFGIVEAAADEAAIGETITAPPTTSALNSAETFRGWLAEARTAENSDAFDALATAAQDSGMSDADFLQLAEETISKLRDIDAEAAAELAAAMETAMAAKVKAELTKS